MYLLFMGCLLTALVLAARSGQPREYSGAEGVIQGICEAISLLYIILWLVVTFLPWLVCIQHTREGINKHNTTQRIIYQGAKKLLYSHDTLDSEQVLRI